MQVCDRCKQEAELYCFGNEVFCDPCLTVRTTTELRGMPVKWSYTGRGFILGEFHDLYQQPCSIQESSIATNHAIWLGTDKDRIHLSLDSAVTLIEILQEFVKTGDLSKYAPNTENNEEGYL